MQRTIERRYPLVELGWDRVACQNYILSCGQPLPAPSWCRRCPFKGETDLVLMEREDPDGLAEWVELEKAKLAAAAEKFPDLPPKKNLGVFKETDPATSPGWTPKSATGTLPTRSSTGSAWPATASDPATSTS